MVYEYYSYEKKWYAYSHKYNEIYLFVQISDNVTNYYYVENYIKQYISENILKDCINWFNDPLFDDKGNEMKRCGQYFCIISAVANIHGVSISIRSKDGNIKKYDIPCKSNIEE